MSRKVYNRQFKLAAVQLLLEENIFVKEVSKELSIHSNTLYHWISEYGESALPLGICFTHIFNGVAIGILSSLAIAS
ncbi:MULTISPECIES: transposase [Bacillus cereus group]|uniref:transposase n=1 Tax=Bacillus cereus group TaxID=86661 RepID=UPI00032EE6D3|nr:MULTISPECIES: transposase [Bacillus cereus group]EOO12604.1 hypothetical protein IG9_05421 [Bacillus cereus HuA2-9]MCZ6942995.1 transposase [Bacillus mycoides]